MTGSFHLQPLPGRDDQNVPLLSSNGINEERDGRDAEYMPSAPGGAGEGGELQQWTASPELESRPNDLFHQKRPVFKRPSKVGCTPFRVL